MNCLEARKKYAKMSDVERSNFIIFHRSENNDNSYEIVPRSEIAKTDNFLPLASKSNREKDILLLSYFRHRNRVSSDLARYYRNKDKKRCLPTTT